MQLSERIGAHTGASHGARAQCRIGAIGNQTKTVPGGIVYYLDAHVNANGSEFRLDYQIQIPIGNRISSLKQ